MNTSYPIKNVQKHGSQIEKIMEVGKMLHSVRRSGLSHLDRDSEILSELFLKPASDPSIGIQMYTVQWSKNVKYLIQGVACVESASSSPSSHQPFSGKSTSPWMVRCSRARKPLRLELCFQFVAVIRTILDPPWNNLQHVCSSRVSTLSSLTHHSAWQEAKPSTEKCGSRQWLWHDS